MSKARGWLYRLARLAGDVEAVGSRRPRKMVRRAKNKIVGRLLRPFWKWLWR